MRVSIKVKQLNSILDKSIGLIGKEISPVYFTTRYGIHTFGVKKPIDILILDNAKKIVKIKQSLLSNRIFFWNPRFSKVIELPQGTVEKMGARVGDKVDLRF